MTCPLAAFGVRGLPACAHSCYTGSMLYGPLDELLAKMEEKPEMVLFRPKNAK